MILVANKVDLVHLRKVTEDQGRELASQLQVGVSGFLRIMCGVCVGTVGQYVFDPLVNHENRLLVVKGTTFYTFIH